MSKAPKTVLVVDDDEAVCDLTATILRSAGYQVVTVGDGAQAIAWLDANRADLAMVDLIMPNVDGWGVVEHVRRMSDPPPVVVVTGMHDVVPPGRLHRYVAGYLIKPFSVPQLLKTCQVAMDVPQAIPATGDRKEPRRTFAVKTTLLSEMRAPLVEGQIVQLSRHGLRLELAVPLAPGDSVRVAFRLPGRPEPLEVTGRVKWQNEISIGAEIDQLSPEDEQLLRELLDE